MPQGESGWSVLVLKDNDLMDMPEIGLSIQLTEFYEGVTFENQQVEDSDDPAPAG
jgi:hypothetical protein